MTTLDWNVKLLGNLSARDFAVWKEVAGIPSCYVFNVSDGSTAGCSTTSQGENCATRTNLTGVGAPIPDEDNTIIVAGRDDYNLFEPYCFEGHKITMNTEFSDYNTGTRMLSLMMNTDGLLDKGIIETLQQKVDMTKWIKKNHKEAAAIIDSMDKYTDSEGYLDDSNEAVILENAICKYVLATLGIYKPS
jgi:deoxycytidylate deaminase